MIIHCKRDVRIQGDFLHTTETRCEHRRQWVKNPPCSAESQIIASGYDDRNRSVEDVVVMKRRASAFAGTDLDRVLRGQAVDTIAIAGVAISAMVAATFCDAADRDYRITVLRDGCADGDPATHDFFMDKVFPGRGAEVVAYANWL